MYTVGEFLLGFVYIYEWSETGGYSLSALF